MKALPIQPGAFDCIAASLRDEAGAWSFGTFGAGIEIRRQPGRPVLVSSTAAHCTIITPAGAASWRDTGALRAVAFETAIGRGSSWGQGIALCMPEAECGTGRRTRLMEIGPDEEALHAPDRDAILFDLGLGARQVDICVRTADPAFVAALRAMRGSALLEAGDEALSRGILAMPLDLVISCPFGRAECPIGPGAGEARGYVLPRWMRLRRSHAATTPIPRGWLPCAHIFPAHPLRLGPHGTQTMDLTRHAAFQAALRRFGDADHVRIKSDYFAALANQSAFTPPDTPLPPRFARAAAEVARRQARATGIAGA